MPIMAHLPALTIKCISIPDCPEKFVDTKNKQTRVAFRNSNRSRLRSVFDNKLNRYTLAKKMDDKRLIETPPRSIKKLVVDFSFLDKH